MWTRTPEEWQQVLQDSSGQTVPLACTALRTMEDGSGRWQSGSVLSWDAASRRYNVRWVNGQEDKVLSLHVFFEGDDPVVFADRLKKALEQRRYANSLLKYHFFVDSMPEDRSRKIGRESVSRISRLAKGMLWDANSEFADKLGGKLETLLQEAQREYIRVQNLITFEKVRSQGNLTVLPADLKLPPPPEAAPVPYMAVKVLPSWDTSAMGAPDPQVPRGFRQAFEWFCKASLAIRPEVCAALQVTRGMCLDLLTEKVFETAFNSPLRLQEFSERQEASIMRLKGRLGMWVNTIRMRITQCLQQATVKWYHLNETSLENYRASRLRPMLVCCGLMMSNAFLLLGEVAAGTTSRRSHAAQSDMRALVIASLVTTSMQSDFQVQVLEALTPLRVEMASDRTVKEDGKEETAMPSEQGGCRMAEAAAAEDKKKTEKKGVCPDLVFVSEKTDLAELKQVAVGINNGFVHVLDWQKSFHLPTERCSCLILFEIIIWTDPIFTPTDAWVQDLRSRLEVREKGVDCSDSKGEESVQLLLKYLADTLEVNIHEATAAFEGIFAKLQTQVSTIEECSDMKDFLKSIPSELAKLAGAVNEAISLTDLVEDLHYELPAETLEARWEMFGSSGLVKSRAAKCLEYLNNKHDEFLQGQESEQKEFETRLVRLEEVIENFSQYKDLGQVREVAEKVRSTSEEIKQCQDLVRMFNSREVLFDRDQTDYSNLNTMIKTFEPYNNLWKTAGDWVNNKEAWLRGPFDEIDPRYCENEVTNGIRLLFKTIRTLKENEETKSICGIAEQIKTELEEFKPNLPLVTGLRNEGMRQRHWATRSSVQVGPGMDGGFTLQRMLDLGLLNFANEVAEVGDRAGKEYGLEKTLNKMKADWEPLQFDLSEKYRKTGTYVLKGDGEAMVLLDEHIVTTQAMMFSTFKGPFEEDIDEWNARLMRVSETLEEWLKCQKAWMYLQPIFDSDDIMRQLPTEGKRFKHVDATWRQEMINTRENPKIIDICATEGLLEKWRECNITLDMVQKGLEDYLETKRNGFARFYFLSNDELLEILSQTKDPTRVQPFLSKVFEAMSKVSFTPDNEISLMVSPEGETVEMVAPIVTHQKAVEVWMGDLQDGMCGAIRNALQVGIGTYPTMERTEWVLSNAAQIVLNGSQVFWTSEVEEAFLPDYAKKLSQQILDLIMLLRKGVTKLQTKTMNALIVIDVHAKDVIWGFVEQGVKDKFSFEWISQLRYYWEVDDRQQENMWVKCVQTSFPYGYEYLGNSMRLVITPLTDMCYITLMGAQSLSLGGAPAGPAGTGKTETTKDLAKALAKQCVVFNCSPEMDYIMVGKFFKGLAFSGAWCCFDEFNRINIEVLSVIAQQLMVLFGKKAEQLGRLW
ncbi:Dnah1, partial [Symbiodinium pilosum]